MKITARTEYATLAALELALREGSSHIQARKIAENQSIPLKFLEQILSQLRTAGLVRSVRGASGGYSLARSASEISLGDVVTAVEGDLGGTESGIEDRAALAVWQELQEEFLTRLASISLRDLVDRELKDRSIPNFQI